MRAEIMIAELLTAYACDLTPFSNALFRDLSTKISPVYYPVYPAMLSTDALLRPFQPFVYSRFDVKSTAAPRWPEEIPRMTHPEILDFNCAPDISG